MYHICRLCLTFSSKNFQKVLDIEPKCFKLCLPEIELGAIDLLEIYRECVESIQAAYAFKTKCLEAEMIIKDYLKKHVFTKSSHIDLRTLLSLKAQADIYAVVKNIKQEVVDIDRKTEFIATRIVKLKNHRSLDEERVREPERMLVVKTETNLSRAGEASQLREQLAIRGDDGLLEHVGLHFETKCRYCQKCFKDSTVLEAHMIEIHTSNKNNVYSCDICSQEFTENIHLLVHILSHFEKPGCWACQKCFADVKRLKQHMHDAHRIIIKSFNKTHQDREEFGNIYFEIDESQLMKSVLTHLKKYRSNSVNFCCEICDKSFEAKASLDDHIKLHFCRPKCMTCNNFFYNSYCLKRHISNSHGVKAETPHENDTETANGMEIKHFEDKREIDRSSIDTCPNEQASNLEINTFTCIYCDKYFHAPTPLKSHVFAVHGVKINEQEKPFECKKCGEKFDKRKKFSQHIYTPGIHTSGAHGINIKKREKPFKCEQCGKKFNRKKDLSRHSVTHAPTNRGFDCKVCKNKFASKTTFQTHRKSHSNELKHQCEICKKTFLKSRNLRVHMRTHSF